MTYSPDTRAYKSARQDNVAAEQYNDPDRFTALIGYEWTSNTGGNNLHRNVIYRDNGDRTNQVVPYTTSAPLGGDNPRDLWQWMTAYEQKAGGSVLAIAHNGTQQRPDVSDHRIFHRKAGRQGKSRMLARSPP